MYTRSFSKKNWNIPQDYSGTTFAEPSAEGYTPQETTAKAEETEEAGSISNPPERELQNPPEERPVAAPTNDEASGLSTLLTQLGLDGVNLSDIVILLTALLLQKDVPEESELPLALLLLLLIH